MQASFREANRLEVVYTELQARAARHLRAIQEIVRQPSVSTDGTGMRQAAGQMVDLLESVGSWSRVVETTGYPVVIGGIDAGRPTTLLIYGMYDVQPAEGQEGWLVPPFSGEIIDLPPFGECIVSRGIYNTKGPLQGFFNVLQVMRDLDALPVNLRFVIEGEEEIGSNNLPMVFHDAIDELRADAAFIPFYSLNADQRPVIYLGMKGEIFIQLTARGGEWGGPTHRDIHAREAAWVASPVWRLVQALATIVTPSEQIAIAGYYDHVRGPDAEDLELLEGLRSKFVESAYLDEVDAVKFKVSSSGVDLLRHYLFTPTFNIDGIGAGYMGPEQMNLVPHKASAKIDLRIVRDMTVEDTLRLVREHLNRNGFPEIELEVLSAYGTSRTSVREAVAQALIATCEEHGYPPEVWPYNAASAPYYLFSDAGIPWTMGGLGQGGRPHVPNEYAVVESLPLFEKSMATFLSRFAEAAAPEAARSQTKR